MTPSPADAEEIRQLVAKYNFAADLRDTDTLLDCFTDDGTFENVGQPEGSALAGRYEGREAVRAFMSRYHASSTGGVRHWNWNLLIDVDGDHATMQCYLMALSASRGTTPAAVRSTGIYRDKLRREDGRWRFVERQVTADSCRAERGPRSTDHDCTPSARRAAGCAGSTCTLRGDHVQSAYDRA